LLASLWFKQRYEGHRIYQIQNTAVGRARNQNGEASYKKKNTSTNNSLQETDRKIQETMRRWSERECRYANCHKSWENQAKDRETWSNTQRRLMFRMDCYAIVAQ
jgi:hypothetical protein